MPTLDILAEKPMYAMTRIETWQQGVEIANALPGWIFRGQNSAKYALRPRFEREAELHQCPGNMLPGIERGILYEFQRRAHQYISPLPEDHEYIEWLSILQHHGGPTRLLDFSKSFYVAAFFSIEDSSGDSAIWGFNHIKQSLVRNWPQEQKAEGTFYQELNELALKTAELYLGFETPAPGVLALEPRRMSERLSVQQGCFLFPCNVSMPFEQNLKAELRVPKPPHDAPMEVNAEEFKARAFDQYSLVKLVIPHDLHLEILMDLAKMNITGASLFPGLDGFARSLWFNVRVAEGYEQFRMRKDI